MVELMTGRRRHHWFKGNRSFGLIGSKAVWGGWRGLRAERKACISRNDMLSGARGSRRGPGASSCPRELSEATLWCARRLSELEGHQPEFPSKIVQGVRLKVDW